MKMGKGTEMGMGMGLLKWNAMMVWEEAEV
jgi:hypothetical protein